MQIEPRTIREKLSLTILEMANKCGVSLGTVNTFEAGSLSPSLRTRRKLAAGYGITVEQVEAFCGIRSPNVPAA
jgi:transcriptional regulator with XRE-family HTH domain